MDPRELAKEASLGLSEVEIREALATIQEVGLLKEVSPSRYRFGDELQKLMIEEEGQGATDDPFATFSEWDSAADRKAYGAAKSNPDEPGGGKR